MKNLLIILMLIPVGLFAQEGANYWEDSGTLGGFHLNENTENFEESVLLLPAGPGEVERVFVYYGGDKTARDTIWFVQDPTDGGVTTSIYGYHLAAYGNVEFTYDGQRGWKEFDVRNLDIRAGGLNRLGVNHVIKPGGPYFGVDNEDQSMFRNSYINDVYTPNPDFYNLLGTRYFLAGGHFMARLKMNYDYPKGTSSEPAPEPSLADVTREAGLTNSNGEVLQSVMATAVDWNNDGFVDVAIGSNFFENNGDGTFTRVNEKFNGASAAGTIFGDLDNDGYMDFFAMRGGGQDKIYWGSEEGTFTEETDVQVINNAPTVTPMFLDFDKDGLLDIYIAYGRTSDSQGNEQYYPDALFKNLGDRKFQDVTEKSGIAAGEPQPFYDSWGASITDFNDDGYPDIFVATYRLAPDLLYQNNKNGTFTEVGRQTGARGVPTFADGYFGHGMGSDWGDYDNDGDLDLAIGNLSHIDQRALSSNKSLILRNESGASFEDATNEMNLRFFEMNAGMVWVDLNNDGFLDLVHAQYAYYKEGEGNDKYTRFYINGGKKDNFRLFDRTWEFGSKIHGAWCPIRLDYDNDGDMDVLVASNNENVKLFRNDIQKSNNWLAIKVEANPGSGVNTTAYGTKIKVRAGGQNLSRFLPGSVMNGRASQSSNILHFGLGAAETIDDVTVLFADGTEIKIPNADINRYYTVNQSGEVTPWNPAPPILEAPYKHTDISGELVLSWLTSGGAVSYDYEIALDDEFANIVANGEVETNSVEVEIEGQKTYYWRVKANWDEGSSPWSSVWQFDYGIAASAPDVPQLASPANGAENISVTPEFTWGPVESDRIQMQISTNPEFTKIVHADGAIDGNASSYQLGKKLDPETVHYWRIRAGVTVDGQSVWSDWSEPYSFTTEVAGSVEDWLINGVVISSPFPNPVSDMSLLNISLERTSHVKVTLCSQAGNELMVLNNGRLPEGDWDIPIFAKDFANGMYFVKIEIRGNIYTEKVVILK